MNLLVQALREHPDALLDVDPSADVPYRRLASMAAVDQQLGPLLRAADVDPLISEALSQSFAGVVLFAAWNEAGETGFAQQVEPRALREWVTIVPVAGRDYGVTLPDDRLDDQRISLFTRFAETVRRISIVVIPGDRPSLELRMAGGECGYPYRGTCGGGTCQDCRQFWIARPGEPAGYACSCEDAASGGLEFGEAHTRDEARGVLVERAAPPERRYA